jgi:hypothetical protein
MCFLYNNSFFCTASKEREKVLKQAQFQMQKSMSRGNTPTGTPTKGAKKNTTSIASGASTPARENIMDQQQLDITGLNLNDSLTGKKLVAEEPPKVNMAREKVLEEAKSVLEAHEGKKGISIVVIGDIFFPILCIIQLRVLFEAMSMPGSLRLWADYYTNLVVWMRRQGEPTKEEVKK